MVGETGLEPVEVALRGQTVIAERSAVANPHDGGGEYQTWGEERIANELKLKLGMRVARSTVRKYLARGHGPDGRDPSGNRCL